MLNKWFLKDDHSTDSNYHGEVRAELTDFFINSTSGVTEVSLNELKEIIKGSKPSKAPGPDGILNLTLIKNINVLASNSVKLVNSCLKISYFPKSWKNANIMV